MQQPKDYFYDMFDPTVSVLSKSPRINAFYFVCEVRDFFIHSLEMFVNEESGDVKGANKEIEYIKKCGRDVSNLVACGRYKDAINICKGVHVQISTIILDAQEMADRGMVATRCYSDMLERGLEDLDEVYNGVSR